VYERPHTEFVAGFVGVSNVLEEKGRRITVRPEKIIMSHEGPGRPGTIADVIYVGSFTRYVIELDTGETLTVVRQNDRPVEEQGTRIVLDWSPEHAYVIDPPKEEE
jgi:ABC-type Fe3+/spermidine/putrescine transport system ATPase subunit